MVLLRSLAGCRWPLYIVVNEAKSCSVEWLDLLRQSGRVIEVEENRFELGAIRAALDLTDLEEFVLLQDSFEVKDQSFLDICFSREESVALGPTFFHYAGKWKRSVLEQMEIPEVFTKKQSIYWEHAFSRAYWERESVWVFDEHFHDGENQGFVEMFGRTNMLLENDYYIKRKGNWGQIA